MVEPARLGMNIAGRRGGAGACGGDPQTGLILDPHVGTWADLLTEFRFGKEPAAPVA